MDANERAALRGAAEKATPGPWAVEDTAGLDISPDVMTGEHVIASTVTSDMAKQQDKLNAAYIAAAHPAAVLALLAENERMRAALRKVIGYEGHQVYCGHGKDDSKPCVCGLNAAHEAARAALSEPGA